MPYIEIKSVKGLRKVLALHGASLRGIHVKISVTNHPEARAPGEMMLHDSNNVVIEETPQVKGAEPQSTLRKEETGSCARTVLQIIQ